MGKENPVFMHLYSLHTEPTLTSSRPPDPSYTSFLQAAHPIPERCVWKEKLQTGWADGLLLVKLLSFTPYVSREIELLLISIWTNSTHNLSVLQQAFAAADAEEVFACAVITLPTFFFYIVLPH